MHEINQMPIKIPDTFFREAKKKKSLNLYGSTKGIKQQSSLSNKSNLKEL